MSTGEVVALLTALAGIVAALGAVREARSPEMKLAIETLQKRVGELEADRQAARADVAKLEQENEELKGRIVALEADRDEGRVRVEQLEQENVRLQARVEELGGEITQRDERIIVLEQDLRAAQERIKVLEHPRGARKTPARGGRR